MKKTKVYFTICWLIIFFLYSNTPVFAKELSYTPDLIPQESQLTNPEGMWWCDSKKIRTITIIRWGTEHPKPDGETRFGAGGIKVECGKKEVKILYCPENHGVSVIKKQKHGVFFIKCAPYL